MEIDAFRTKKSHEYYYFSLTLQKIFDSKIIVTNFMCLLLIQSKNIANFFKLNIPTKLNKNNFHKFVLNFFYLLRKE